MQLLSATRHPAKACLNFSLLRPPTVSSINTCTPLYLTHLSSRPYVASFHRPFALLSRSPRQRTPRTDRNLSTEHEPKPSIKEKLQAVRAERIWTIPNVLTISRILSCPALGYAILNDNFYFATGLLVYAGLTDLVRVQFTLFTLRSCSFVSSCNDYRLMVT